MVCGRWTDEIRVLPVAVFVDGSKDACPSAVSLESVSGVQSTIGALEYVQWAAAGCRLRTCRACGQRDLWYRDIQPV